MSQPNRHGGQPRPPPTGTTLSNYFTGQDSSDVFAFATGETPSSSSIPYNQPPSSAIPYQINAPSLSQYNRPSLPVLGLQTIVPEAGSEGPTPVDTSSEFPPSDGPPDKSHLRQRSDPFVPRPPLSESDSTPLFSRQTSAPPTESMAPQQTNNPFTLATVNRQLPLPSQVINDPFSSQFHQGVGGGPALFPSSIQLPTSVFQQTSQSNTFYLSGDQQPENSSHSLPTSSQLSSESEGPHPMLHIPPLVSGPPLIPEHREPATVYTSPQESLPLLQSTGGELPSPDAELNQSKQLSGSHANFVMDNTVMQPTVITNDSSQNFNVPSESSGAAPDFLPHAPPHFLPHAPPHFKSNQVVDSTESATYPSLRHSELTHPLPKVMENRDSIEHHIQTLSGHPGVHYVCQQPKGEIDEGVEFDQGETKAQFHAPVGLIELPSLQQPVVSSGSGFINQHTYYQSDTSTVQTDSHSHNVEVTSVPSSHTDNLISSALSDNLMSQTESAADSVITTAGLVLTPSPPQQAIAPLKEVSSSSSQGTMPTHIFSPTNANQEFLLQSDHQPTSLTGSNVSTGTNTPLPPVAALSFCHSQSVPNNLNGVAEKLTNAFYAPGLSYTNADCSRSEAKSESTSLPCNTNADGSTLPSNAVPQMSAFSIGPTFGEDDKDDEDNDADVSDVNIFPVNREEELQETGGEERAVIEGDSNPPSASQSISSFLEGPEEDISSVTGTGLDLQDESVQTPTVRPTTTNINEDSHPQDPGSCVPISQGPVFSQPKSQDPFSVQHYNSSGLGPTSVCSVVTSFPPFSNSASVSTVSNTTSLVNVKPFIPPSSAGTANTANPSNQVREPVLIDNSYRISQSPVPHPRDQMMEEDTRNTDAIPSQPDGQEPPLPPSFVATSSTLPLPPGASLSLPSVPTVDLTIDRPPLPSKPSTTPPPPPQSLHSSSSSAFSSIPPQPVTDPLLCSSDHPPPPPVLPPHSNLNRNPSLTNAGTIDSLLKTSEASSSAPLNVVDHAPPTNQESNAKLSLNTREPTTTQERQDDWRDRGREMPETYDSYHRRQDHYRRDHRERYQSRYDQGGDGYYYDNHRQYRQEDRPHSRTVAYQYDPHYDYPSKGYRGDEYREGRHGHYSSYYDDRDYYWRGQRSEYYHDYDRYYYDRYPQDSRYRSYDEHYYRDYYYPNNRERGGYDRYPPDRSHSQQHHHDDLPHPDASSIYSHHDSYMDSPGGHYPAHHKEDFDPRESTRIDQPDYSMGDYSQGPYDDGQYPPDVGERYPIEGYRQEEEEDSFRPIQAPPPVRETPLPFAHPHVSIRFGIGGHLVTVLPVIPSEQSPAVVEIHSLKTLVPQASELSERASVLPGPLLPGDTFKSSVIKYVAQKSEECIRVSQDPELSVQKRDMASDDALLWHFLVLMCQQNGVLVPSDISDLLMREASLPMSKSPIRGVGVGGVKDTEKEDDALNEFRQFLLSGRKKDALEYACKRSLWGHALMLSSRMDDQSRTYVVNRFTASLPTTDPLNTFYTMMLGRIPSVVRPEGLGRAGDWKSHLAMMVANNQEKSNIATLGDSLMSQGRVFAAHLCYHLSGLQLGSDSDTQHKYLLLGINTTGVDVPVYLPEPEELCRTEVFEYALGLSRMDFTLPPFQTHKLLHAYRLFECGLLEKALDYCESISYYVTRDVSKYSQIFLVSLQELSTRLHHAICPLGVMETELPSWIIHLEQSMGEMRSNNQTPSASRDSPSLASASNLAAQQTAQYANSTQENVFCNYSEIPNETVPQVHASEQSQMLVPPTLTYQPQTHTPVITEPLEQDSGQQQFDNKYSQALPTDQQPSQVAVGRAEYQPEGIGNLDQQQHSIQTNIDPYSHQSQSTDPSATATSNQFTGEPWGNYGMMTEGYGNYVEPNPTASSQETGLPSAGEGYLQSDGSQVSVQGGGIQYNQYQQPPQALPPSFGFKTDLQVEPSVSSHFNPVPSISQQSEEPPLSTSQEKGKDEEEEEKKGKKKDNKGESANKQGQSGWLGGILNWIPKGSKRAHLPPDKNKRIYFDKEKRKWIDLDADEEETNRPAAPPTDNELTKNKSASHTPENQTDGVSAPPSNQYSRGRLGRGARSKYVDVMNKDSSGNTNAPPSGAGPPPPTLLPPMMPPVTAVPPMQFNPNHFFTGTGNASANPSDNSSSDRTVGINPSEHPNQDNHLPQNQVSGNTPSLQAATHPQSHPSLPMKHGLPSQPQSQQGQPPPQSRSGRTMSEGSSTSIDLDMPEDKKEDPPPPIQPQFFNPSAFSSVTKATGQQKQHLNRMDPFPDNVSEVSEYSLEVSRINSQASNRQRTRYQYPSGPMTSRPQYPSSVGTSGRPTGGQPHPPPPGTGGKWL